MDGLSRHRVAILEIINFLGNKILGGIVNVGRRQRRICPAVVADVKADVLMLC
jgi:hypothetical protein